MNRIEGKTVIIPGAICYVANAPPHVNVLQIVLICTAQRSAAVLHKEIP